MSTYQASLTEVHQRRTDAGHEIGDHLAARAADQNHDAACTDCGRQITISPRSGIERGHGVDCQYQGRKAGDER